MGRIKDSLINKLNAGPDDTDWDNPDFTLSPPPDQIDLDSGKQMWVINGYKIWARSYKEALELLPMIENF